MRPKSGRLDHEALALLRAPRYQRGAKGEPKGVGGKVEVSLAT
jgi:hypothetical protein